MNHEAIYNTHASVVRIDDTLGAFDAAGNEVTLNQSAIDTEAARLQTVQNNTAYARARAVAYPADADFKEAWTEKEIGGDSTKWDAYVTAYNKVRSDNPKP